MEARQFFLNASSRAFEAGGATAFFQEDVEAIELYFVRPSSSLNQPLDYYDYSSNSVKLAVGLTAPAAVVTAWSAISTAVTATITNLATGGGSSNAIQEIAFAPRPQLGSFAIQFPARNITVSSASASTFICLNPHGLYNGQTVTLTGFTISGAGFSNGDVVYVRDRTERTFRAAATENGGAISFTLSSGGGTAQLAAQTTDSFAYNVSPEVVQGAIARLGFAINGVNQIFVTGRAGQNYVLSYGGGSANINFDPVTVVGSTLARFPGLSANLNFNTNEIASLISSGNTSVNIEVEVGNGTLRQTYRTSATLASDIIKSTSPAPVPTITPSSSFNLTSDDSSVWSVSIDNNGVLTATKQ